MVILFHQLGLLTSVQRTLEGKMFNSSMALIFSRYIQEKKQPVIANKILVLKEDR